MGSGGRRLRLEVNPALMDGDVGAPVDFQASGRVGTVSGGYFDHASPTAHSSGAPRDARLCRCQVLSRL
jgi:hypothetical protein